jgi:excisionase family DNA binding protein
MASSDGGLPRPKDNSATALPTLLTIADVGRMFGRDDRTIRRWIQKGLLPAVRVGRSAFISSDEVRALISAAIDAASLAAGCREKPPVLGPHSK